MNSESRTNGNNFMNKRNNVKIQDSFWMHYRNLVRNEMLPYQWKVLNDEADIQIEKERDDDFIPNQMSHVIQNFSIAAGRTAGQHYGWVFQDSDAYKWLEAAAYSLQEEMDDTLKQKADWLVDLIGDAQEADGYLDTYFTIRAPERKWKRLSESHELYCAGHFMEAAVAYREATGNEKALQNACRLADCIDARFGYGEGKLRGYDGHEEIEIGLLRLYQATNEKRYLRLCLFFLEERGRDRGFFERQKKEDISKEPLIAGLEKFPMTYFQNHAPVRKQTSAEGHAVRLVYLYTAAAEAARITKDQELMDACKRIWRSVVDRRMYITGGIGSTVYGESFTCDYDLPNDVMYCETCASVGLAFFARRMLENELCGEYGDVMERALYNTALAGMALDGKHFFYVNPLEAVPELSRKTPGKSHVKCVRPQWLGCACCPPNLARLLASLDRYIYVRRENQAAVILFLNSTADLQMPGGILHIRQETGYPWNGNAAFYLDYTGQDEIQFAIRIPGYATEVSVFRDGKEAEGIRKDGFYFLKKSFGKEKLELTFSMDVKIWRASAKVRADIGKMAVSRGPFVYCAEEADNGPNLQRLCLDVGTKWECRFEPELLGGIAALYADAWRIPEEKCEKLYAEMEKNTQRLQRTRIKLIPYYAWANRGENEMRVWLQERTASQAVD